MKRLILSPLLTLGLALACGSPVLHGQAATHLIVPAKQLVTFRFTKTGPDIGYPGRFSGFFLYRADGGFLGSMSVPAGQALVITDLNISGSIPTQSSTVQVISKLDYRDSTFAGLFLQHEEVFAIPAGTAPFSRTFNLVAGVVFAGNRSPAVELNCIGQGLTGVNEDNFTVFGHGYLVTF